MAKAESIQTNWVVLTGGPSSGKTEVLLNLALIGPYQVVPETARIHIMDQKTRGLTVEQIRKDEGEFQRLLLDMKLKVEDKLDVNRRIFLDRGIPDSIVYAQVNGLENPVTNRMLHARRYDQIFFFDQLPYIYDGVRIEGEDTALKLGRMLKKVYLDLDYKVTDVPVMPIGDRAKFILRHLNR